MAQFLRKISGGKMKSFDAATGSAGDIAETSFSAANNQATPVDVTGLLFANASVSSAKIFLSVDIQATADLYEMFELKAVQKNSGWDLSVQSVGDSTNVVFSITSSGQIQYTSASEAGFSSSTFRFRAITTSK